MAKQPSQPQQAERAYPGIEVFLESNDRSAVAERFEATRKAIEELPKPKAEHGKRALVAIQHTEALLNQLFDVKEKLVTDAAQTKKARR